MVRGEDRGQDEVEDRGQGHLEALLGVVEGAAELEGEGDRQQLLLKDGLHLGGVRVRGWRG